MTRSASAAETAAFHSASLKRELADYLFVLEHPKGYERLASILNNIGAVYFEKRAPHPALCPVVLLTFSQRTMRPPSHSTTGRSACARLTSRRVPVAAPLVLAHRVRLS